MAERLKEPKEKERPLTKVKPTEGSPVKGLTKPKILGEKPSEKPQDESMEPSSEQKGPTGKKAWDNPRKEAIIPEHESLTKEGDVEDVKEYMAPRPQAMKEKPPEKPVGEDEEGASGENNTRDKEQGSREPIKPKDEVTNELDRPEDMKKQLACALGA